MLLANDGQAQPTPSNDPSPTVVAAASPGTASPAASNPRPTETSTPEPTQSPTPEPTPGPTPEPTTDPTPEPTPQPTPLPTTAAPSASITSELVGRWTPVAGSWAGYEVTIDVPFFGTSDVAGRTEGITGFSQIEQADGGYVLAAAELTGDMTQLTSGDRLVDNQVRRMLQVDTYPTASFVLTRPVPLPPEDELRAGANVPLPGRLTLLGQNRDVLVPATIVYDGEQVTVTAAIEFALSDFGISTDQGLFTVSDQATFLFELHLAPGG